MKRLPILLALLALLLAACGSTGQTSATVPAPTVVHAMPTLQASSAPAHDGQTALQIVQTLKAHGMPIDQVYAYTDVTDLNHLLGRPGQYISKVEFSDTRIPSIGDQGANLNIIDGGSVEVFTTVTDAQKRFEYLQAISKSGVALFAEYEYLDGITILRLSMKLTPAQAAAYKTAFLALSPTTQPAQATATLSPTPLAHFKVGQTVQVGDIWQITVTKTQRVTPGQYDYIKKPGDVILVISVSLKNISSGEQTVYSYGQFTLRDSTGTAASPSYTQSAQQVPNGKVEANMPISGDLVYEIPPGEHHFTLAFETNLFVPGQTIWDITA